MTTTTTPNCRCCAGTGKSTKTTTGLCPICRGTRYLLVALACVASLGGCDIEGADSNQWNDRSHNPSVAAPAQADQPELDWSSLVPACGAGYTGCIRYYEPDARSYLYCEPTATPGTDPCDGLRVLVVGAGGIVVCDLSSDQGGRS
jgi:hypothetical protein